MTSDHRALALGHALRDRCTLGTRSFVVGPAPSQLRRAAASVPLNLAEGRRRSGRDRQHLFRIAAGSAAEVRACLLVAQAWGWLAEDGAAESLALIDRVLAMCWRLTR